MIPGTRLRDVFKKVAVPAIAVTVALTGNVVYNAATRQELQGVTVNQTDSSFMRKGEGFGFTKTVYKTDQGDFKNTWSPVQGKFSSSEIESQLKVGGTYDLTVTGVRIAALGMYPNIISAKPSAPKPPGK